MSEAATHTLSSLEILTFLALLLPLLSFVIAVVTAERYSWLVSLITTLVLMGSTIAAGFLLAEQWGKESYLISINWFHIGSKDFSADLMLSDQSILMLFVVSAISFLVHLYSIGYMAGDTNVKRYFAMLGFFTFSMQGIILSDNLLVLFVFWELVGFSSYILIGHYTEKPEAAHASTKAFIMNRIGDAGFLIGLMIIWSHTGSLSLSEFVSTGATYPWQTAASLCLFCGVIGKSAQFPLFTWLPDAMEGPTPVSALIHAATMVAAGVYLLARVLPFFTPLSLSIVAVTGAITALIGAVAAISQYDIKKILAYSTMSQLGLMIIALGMGRSDAALLHLFTHAFFKACLFLSAGAVIHTLHLAQQRSHDHFDVQDIRNLGGLRKKLPITFITFVISGASLAGIPFFSGFLSKEAILSAIWTQNSIVAYCLFSTVLAVSFLTVLYTFRMIWNLFMGEERRTTALQIFETPVVMRLPVIILAAASVWVIVSWNPFNVSGWLFKANDEHSLWLTVISSLWILIAFIVAYLIYRKGARTSTIILQKVFYIDQLYTRATSTIMPTASGFVHAFDSRIIDRIIHASAYTQVTLAYVIGWIDRTVVDGAVKGATKLASGVGSLTRTLQGGKIQLYIFWAIFTIIIFLIWTLN
jgi:NADH-quinone oxidoreductase subunit L